MSPSQKWVTVEGRYLHFYISVLNRWWSGLFWCWFHELLSYVPLRHLTPLGSLVHRFVVPSLSRERVTGLSSEWLLFAPLALLTETDRWVLGSAGSAHKPYCCGHYCLTYVSGPNKGSCCSLPGLLCGLGEGLEIMHTIAPQKKHQPFADGIYCFFLRVL